MSMADVAERLGVTKRTAERLYAQRVITHYRIGGSVKFSRDDVEAYIASCRVEADPRG